ncbi:hypothetical protein [Flexithrix dorotheae]|uniref:hypothetical protein n=1 Tax=Flexithrix dorotheae TaxID=70993 RepID=UPI00037B53F9|nr:hypothetical protein [Flexithrix dorotheae]
MYFHKGIIGQAVWFILKTLFFFFLPFIFLIRGAVFSYTYFHLNTWICLFISMGITLLLIVAYLAFFLKKIKYKGRITTRKVKALFSVLGICLILFCGYNILYLSPKNAQSSAVKEEFTSLHPFLRLGVSTILFLDHDLLISDMSRTKNDYVKMGLKVNHHSLHYIQADGYAHAMDIRTSQRHTIRNFLVKQYFNLMGFTTLRHGGTGDHLHISLPTYSRPHAL